MEEAERAVSGALALLMIMIYVHCSLWGQVTSPKARRKNTNVLVPFIGCESDGQVGPLKAPSGRSRMMAIPSEAAERLAYYKAKDGVGALAPRGWHCFGTYGSNGATLYVSPAPINGAELLSSNWKGLTGPAVQISIMEGGTSGRFEVAKTIARVFPSHKDFVEGVIAEGIEPASWFPYGPYPADVLKYQGENVVEFHTPAEREGLGTASRLQKNESPISGAAILFGKEPNLVLLCVRVHSQESDLARFIIQQAEREAAGSGSRH